VDLNDQFPAYWENEKARREISGPAPLNYPGPCPLSEPEARAIADFTRENDFQLVMAFHTQGEEIYWGYRQFEPPEAEIMVKQLSKVSGFRSVRYVDSDAGFKDWFIYKWRKPGFTVECGLGQTPLPISQFDAIWDKAGKILLKGLDLA
jgi:g-D-glutamyl-meso-diaminopimelate peptidase